MPSTIDRLLRTCGLNESESKVFEFLFSEGGHPASLIAKSVVMKRPTVYAALDGLSGRGLITTSKKSGATVYRLISTEQIAEVLEAQARKSFQEIQAAAKELKPKLEQISRRKRISLGAYDVTVVENIDAIYAHLSSVLRSGDFCAIFNPQTACAGDGRAVVQQFLESSAKSKPTVRELAVPGPDAEWYVRTIKNKNHEVRMLPKGVKLTSDIIMGSGSVLIAHYVGKRDLGLQIEHKELTQSLKQMFELLWEQAK